MRFELENVLVFIHVSDRVSNAKVIQIDVEHPALDERIESDENSVVDKDGGIFIDCKPIGDVQNSF